MGTRAPKAGTGRTAECVIYRAGVLGCTSAHKKTKDMEVVIWRKYREKGFTISRLYVDGKFLCHILEDEDRGLMQGMSVGEIMNIKLAGLTAIPVGNYKIIRQYSPRFKKILPSIPNVKGYAGVRRHAGNSSKDTEGCPLFGDADEKNIRDWVSNSRKRFTQFDTMLQVAGGEADLHIVWDYDECK